MCSKQNNEKIEPRPFNFESNLSKLGIISPPNSFKVEVPKSVTQLDGRPPKIRRYLGNRENKEKENFTRRLQVDLTRTKWYQKLHNLPASCNTLVPTTFVSNCMLI